MPMLIAASGVTDVFDQPGSVCQATELWRIRCQALGLYHVAMDTAALGAPRPGTCTDQGSAPRPSKAEHDVRLLLDR